MRERLQIATSSKDTAEATLLEGVDAEAALEQLQIQSSEMTRRLLNAALALPMSEPGRSDTINDLLKQLAATDPLAALEFANDIPSLRDADRRSGICV